MKLIKHVFRRICIKFANLFSGMHFFKMKRAILNLAPEIYIGENTRIVGPIWAGSVSKISIGENTFVNREFSIEGNGSCAIGDNIDIGPCVKILTGGHRIGNATHRAGEGMLYDIKIKNGTWIGADSIILGNTIVGEGCVIGAGTLVNKSLGDNVLIVASCGEVKKKLD